MRARNYQCGSILHGGIHAWNQEAEAHIAANSIAGLRLVDMIDVVILVVPMQALCFSTRPNLHAESGVHDRVAGVGVAGFAVVVVSCFVDEYGEELVD